MFDTLCYLATVFTSELAQKHNVSCPEFEKEATKRSIKAMRASEIEDPDAHTGFIMQVFGYEARLKKSEFYDTVCDKKCNWIFSPSKIRKRIVPFQDEKVLDEIDA